jgi:hypothetical protein
MATYDAWTLFVLEMEELMLLYCENSPVTVIIKWNAQNAGSTFVLRNVLMENARGQIFFLTRKRKREAIEYLHERLTVQLHNS